ncbi:MAG TPA: hypothetical protein VGT24_11400 [Candidatus Acidoferrales bacterium]|nr:hypothetical protein [Candidatus Acidoferrales bacterium]
MKHKLLLAVWLLASVVWACLIGYMFLRGSDADTVTLSKDLGAIWGATTAFLIGPAWKAIRQWPPHSQQLLVAAILFTAVVIGIFIKIRSNQTAKIENLFAEIHDVGTKGAPQKQFFLRVAREKPQNLPEYFKRCAELDAVIDDYAATEEKMDVLLAQLQQEIGQLKPQGSYGQMLPMLGAMRQILAKDLEGHRVYRQEVDYAKQLQNISEKDKVQFFVGNIEPMFEEERKIGRDELQIMKDAKARGVAMPDNMLHDAGLN